MGAPPDRLQAFFGTMNAGNEPINGLSWVPALGRSQSGQYDIIVLAMQECQEITGAVGNMLNFMEQPKQSLTGGKNVILSASRLGKMLLERIGDEYTIVVDLMLCAMRLVVMVLTRHAITGVESDVEATGALHVVGNKGGLVAKLEVCGTSLCFIGAHLAAHRKERFMERRNHDVREILQGAKLGNPKLDVTQFDHCT
jgi:phosphatidylinositol-bisphosphatase